MLALRYYLWIAPNVFVALLLAVLLCRKNHRQLPWFVAYLSFQIAGFVASVFFRLHHPFPGLLYRWLVGVFGTGIQVFFGVGTIYELTSKLLPVQHSFTYALRICLCALAGAIILAATVSAAGLFYVSPNLVTNVFQSLDFAAHLVIAGLLLVVFGLARALAVPWPRWQTGIPLGLGIASSASLVGAALGGAFGYPAFIPVDILDLSAFHIAVIVWMIYLLRKPRPAGPVQSGFVQADLELWGQQLQRMVH